jgi:hypothetical protein
LDPFDFGNLIGIKLQETETFFQQDQENEVKATRDHAHRHHPPELAEFLAFLDEVHALEFHSHDDGSVPWKRLRNHKSRDLQNPFLGQFVDAGSDRVFLVREFLCDGFERLPDVSKLLDNLEVFLVCFHA